ncbi:MAG: dinitrogenase iron-molybdenum cofactor biosynthesis protein [Thermodesulfobacteriota bacterium]
MRKVLIALAGDDVAPRFDLALEALVAGIDEHGAIRDERTIILNEASAESLCNLILSQAAEVVVCCGIQEEHYQYLTWKKVQVYDSVAGPAAEVLRRLADGTLRSGDILLEKT